MFETDVCSHGEKVSAPGELQKFLDRGKTQWIPGTGSTGNLAGGLGKRGGDYRGKVIEEPRTSSETMKRGLELNCRGAGMGGIRGDLEICSKEKQQPNLTIFKDLCADGERKGWKEGKKEM